MEDNNPSILSLKEFYSKIDRLVFINPSTKYEQYTSTSHILKHLHGKIHQYIENKNIIDLGCGTGVISVFCSLIGAKKVLGIDIDDQNVIQGQEFARKYHFSNINWLIAPIEFLNFKRFQLSCSFTTVITNPPFGAWRRGIDIRFVQIGLRIANNVISFHKHHKKTRPLLNRVAEESGFSCDIILSEKLILEKTMKFHKLEKYPVDIDIYVFNKMIDES
ncbi:MAG: METTL5 family protein [Candidatus Hodarchaeales archaeon]